MRALVIDDHPLIQDAVSNVLRLLDAEADIAVTDDCMRALDIAGSGPEPDVVFLDLALPGLSGIAALKRWRAQFPAVSIIVLTATTDQQTVLAAMSAGAAGFIPKSSSNDVMLNAVRLVLAGGKYIPMQVLARVGAGNAVSGRRAAEALSPEALGLTVRQSQVLRLIAKGASNKVICRELRTGRTHGQGARHCRLPRAQGIEQDASRCRGGEAWIRMRAARSSDAVEFIFSRPGIVLVGAIAAR